MSLPAALVITFNLLGTSPVAEQAQCSWSEAELADVVRAELVREELLLARCGESLAIRSLDQGAWRVILRHESGYLRVRDIPSLPQNLTAASAAVVTVVTTIVELDPPPACAARIAQPAVPAVPDLDAATLARGQEESFSVAHPITTRQRARSVTGWTTLGLGVVAGTLVGVGIGLGVESAALSANISPATHTQIDSMRAGQRANDLAETSTVLFVSGLVTGVVAVISAVVFGSTWMDDYWVDQP